MASSTGLLWIATVQSLFLAGCVNAQEITTKNFYVLQLCDPFQKVADKLQLEYNEQPLFTGTGLSFPANGSRPTVGGSMLFVNQDTGTWTMITVYGDGYACIDKVGQDFLPYTN